MIHYNFVYLLKTFGETIQFAKNIYFINRICIYIYIVFTYIDFDYVDFNSQKFFGKHKAQVEPLWRQ